ncbi:MAG TPA: glycosyltransferase family 4 protein [Tepidisphaeraceae bacterium]|jgi:glycosyltransferase involved in cell wall biosynthesis
MKIVHLSTSDIGGGAARAAYRLHTGLRRAGHDSQMLVLWKLSNDPNVTGFEPQRDFFSRLSRKLRRRKIQADFDKYRPTIPPGHEPFSDDRTEHADALVKQIPPCDLINLHWIAMLLDHEHFFKHISRDIPLVWRLADMGPLTGGCHYDDHCGKFSEKCGACPQLGSSDEHDLSRDIWLRRNDALASLGPGQLNLVGTSRWIADQSRKSSLLNRFPVSVIPNGLDTDVYTPRDKRFCRDLWNIPQDAQVVLFLAESLNNRRKGLEYLAQAMAMLKDIPRLLLLSVGGNTIPLDPAVRHLNLGRIDHDRTLSTIYSAADIFVIPSLQESFGQTVIESLACGTPVVGFDAGGIPDMVRPGQTGWLVPTGNAEALANAVRTALSEQDLRQAMSPRCREIAVAEYSMPVQAQAYAQLYQTLLDRKTHSASTSSSPIRTINMEAAETTAQASS